jgi:polysaccharide biosynthesis PFTS motif protein
MMRGYRALRKSGHLDRIAAVKQALTERSLGLSTSSFSTLLMGGGIGSSELIVRQYLLMRLGSVNLNRALLLATGKRNTKVVFPLPPEWRRVIASHGFEVAHFRSTVLWQLYIFMLLGYGIARIAKILLAGLRSSGRSDAAEKPYVYFGDLGPGNIPHQTQGRQSYDVISWYLQWEGRRQDIQAVRHSVPNSVFNAVNGVEIIYQLGPLPLLAGSSEFTKFLIWAVQAITIAVIDILRGRWWHALLLNPAAEAAQARTSAPELLAREYFFHNSNWIYRPLWTYDAEQCGSTVTFYFYSTNCESFKRADGYPPVPYGWKAMNWPRYLVWDEYQADFVQRAVGSGRNITVVGPVWFQNCAADMPKLSRPCVAVFDVTPHRASRYRTLGLETEFYVAEVANSFCEDVSNITRHHDVLMLWKKKRDIGRVAHPHYRHLTEQLAKNDHVVLIKPDISADVVIKSSVAVISMPFTSTALIARSVGKPSAYYDPTGLLQKGDRAAHGILILHGESELDAWLSLNLEIQ